MLRIVARYADRWNSHGTVEEIKLRNATLDRACREVGRDPERIVRSLYYWVPRSQEDPWSSAEAFVQVIDRYREAGITDFILYHPRDDQLDVLEQVATEVIPRLRLA